jgi:NAD+ synthase (glutamine-hydrolysing)
LLRVDFDIVPVTPRPAHVEPEEALEQSVYRALVTGVHDYIYKNGFAGAVVGLSGGVDSALTLAVAVDAVGAENVQAVLMPSRYTSEISIADAQAEAQALGVPYHNISIEPMFEAFLRQLKPLFAGLPADATEENIQARCRGILLMAISNKTGKIVLTTGNKSEMAVGYATLYGDMAGGFAAIKDVSKTLVYRLAGYRNGISPIIPQRVLTRPPSAELAPDQKDEDSLPPYSVLDPILERYVERDESPEDIIKAGFDPLTVRRVAQMVDRNEYKRRQAAPGVRITQRAFGRDRRYPITAKFRSRSDDA